MQEEARSEAGGRRRSDVSARRAFGEDALQGSPMHIEAARGLGDISLAELVNPLNMFPANPLRRHWIGGNGSAATAPPFISARNT